MYGLVYLNWMYFCIIQNLFSTNKLYFIYYLKHEAMQEELEDTKEVIRICKLKKNIQHNGQKKKGKRTKHDLQNIHIKVKIE
jgi:hypothetical protein